MRAKLRAVDSGKTKQIAMNADAKNGALASDCNRKQRKRKFHTSNFIDTNLSRRSATMLFQCGKRLLDPKLAVSVILACFVSGCSSGAVDDRAVAAVKGKIAHKGQPVSGGSVMFTPISTADKKGGGKPAAGDVADDGTYMLSTYGKNDGAIIGKHRVSYAPPPVQFDEATHSENTKLPVSPYAGLVPLKPDYEVVSGSNTIDIDLVSDPNAPKPGS